jgi:histidinol-phosphatase (PHP family)
VPHPALAGVDTTARLARRDIERDVWRAGLAAGLGEAHDLPLDTHMHTVLSPDAQPDALLDAYCAVALQRGIGELAITDHVDFDPLAPAYAFSSFEERERDVREAAERWAAEGLAVRFGVELTYERRYEDDIRDWLRRHPHDFVIGSVHSGPTSLYEPDRVAAFIAGKSLAEATSPYFDEVAAAAQSGLFDTLGHLDVVKRWLVPHVMPDAFAAQPELYEPTLRALVESGTALEVNASGLRQMPREPYPTSAVVARYLELGGRAVTIGSDAHRIEWFAYGLNEAYRLAKGAGLTALAFRRGGDRVWVPIDSRRIETTAGAHHGPNRGSSASL